MREECEHPDLLAVVVLTRNEEHNIVDCLRSVSWADRLYIVDANSTDRTVELAQREGAGIYRRAFLDFADQRNAALDLVDADWVFFVDADERGTPSWVLRYGA